MAQWEWSRHTFTSAEIDGFIPLEELDDSFYWKTYISNLVAPSPIFQKLDIPNYICLLLTGPAGNGKHTAARALTASLANRFDDNPDCFLYVEITSSDFPQELSAQECAQKVATLANVLDQSNGPRFSVLVFDEVQQYSFPSVIVTEVAKLCANRDDLFVIFISEDSTVFPHFIHSSSLHLHLREPNTSQRTKFFQERLNDSIPLADNPDESVTFVMSLKNMTTEELVDKTAGYTYQELSNALYLMKLHVLQNHDNDTDTYVLANLAQPLIEECLSMAKFIKTPSYTPISQYVPIIQQTPSLQVANTYVTPPSKQNEPVSQRITELMSKERSVEEKVELVLSVDFSQS